MLVWLAAHLATKYNAPLFGLFLELAGLGVLGLGSYWAARYGVLSIGAQRSSATNLVATPRDSQSRPFIWLVAHLDSKSQTIPMVVRIGSAVAFTILAAVVTGVVLVLSTLQFPVHVALPGFDLIVRGAMVLAYIAVVAALPIVFCFVGNKSKGALDNATGIASIVLALDELARPGDVGVLITSAEELGLAGARHFVTTQRETGIAINCDTIDDDGKFIFMASGAKIRRLDEAIDRAALTLRIETVGPETATVRGRSGRRMRRLRGMIPGILADNVAFTDAGWESFTISRGNIATLRYVHTPGDTPERIQGTGIAKAAGLIAAIVQELR